MRHHPIVLMYHAFGRRSPAADPFNLFIPPEDLERQLGLLARMFRPLDVPAYVDGWTRGRWPFRSALVTIDDGYVSTLERAAPILARHRVPSVLFVAPERLGGASEWMPEAAGERLLTADELRAVAAEGIEIGSHGMDHRSLVGLPPEELRRQVEGSREALADLLGRRPRTFAYPAGAFDDAARKAVGAAGYEAAFAVDRGGGRFAVTRRAVTARDALATFAVKLLPGYERLWRATEGRPGLRRLGARIARQR